MISQEGLEVKTRYFSAENMAPSTGLALEWARKGKWTGCLRPPGASCRTLAGGWVRAEGFRKSWHLSPFDARLPLGSGRRHVELQWYWAPHCAPESHVACSYDTRFFYVQFMSLWKALSRHSLSFQGDFLIVNAFFLSLRNEVQDSAGEATCLSGGLR